MRKLATSTPLTMEKVANLDALRVRATSCASSPMNSSDCSARPGPPVRETSRAPRRACERSAPGLRFWICWRGRRFGPRRPTTTGGWCPLCEGVQDPLSINYYVYIEYRGGRAAPSMPVTLNTVTYDHARGAEAPLVTLAQHTRGGRITMPAAVRRRGAGGNGDEAAAVGGGRRRRSAAVGGGRRFGGGGPTKELIGEFFFEGGGGGLKSSTL